MIEATLHDHAWRLVDGFEFGFGFMLGSGSAILATICVTCLVVLTIAVVKLVRRKDQ